MNPNDIINNRFRLIRSIGRGSFGEVWLAEDTALGLNVALKIYVALDPRGLEDFKNEFRNVYNIHHTNLLRADYFDSIGDNPYLVMRYCPGSSVEIIGKGTEADLIRFIKDVAKGLAYLHSQDIIHRDIKPDNILRDEVGNFVISDFGLSLKMRTTLLKASKRANNTSSGTIGYMAPELFSSSPQAVKATDIWALGATIYELATGEMPFVGQGGVMQIHGAELPVLPAKYSKQLTSLMHRCLAKDTWDRPTAEQIVAECEAMENGNRPTASNGERQAQPTVNMRDYVPRKLYDKEIEGLRKQLAEAQKSAPTRIDSSGYNTDKPLTAKKTRTSLLIFGGIIVAMVAAIMIIATMAHSSSNRPYPDTDTTTYWDTNVYEEDSIDVDCPVYDSLGYYYY